MITDPFPRALVLGRKELMALMSLDKSEMYEFLKHPPEGFPPPMALGKNKNGKPRLRWDKWKVYSWWEVFRKES